MELTTQRFGNISYEAEDVLTFSEGLIGFPNAHQFIVLSVKPDSPFRWLQCIDDTSLAFLVADPCHFVPTYAPSLSATAAKSLGLQETTARIVFNTVSIPKGQPQEMTMNLAGPLLINAETRQAKQIVLEEDAYSTKHKVFESKGEKTEKIAA